MKIKIEFIENDLIRSAYDLGFESYFGRMKSVNKKCYHLWMHDFQNFLSENYNIFVIPNIDMIILNCITYNVTIYLKDESAEFGFIRRSKISGGKYIDVFESGLLTAIKLINNKEVNKINEFKYTTFNNE